MGSKKGNILFTVCLILGILAILMLLFEGFRYLNDFAPQWYQASDYNFVKGGLAILIVAMLICLALIYFRKLRILASIGFFLVFLISLFTIFGLEDNIRSNKNQIAALNEISERHVEELYDEIKQKDEEIENLMASVNQLNRRLREQQSSSEKVEANSKSTNESSSNNSSVSPDVVKKLMNTICEKNNNGLPIRDGVLTVKEYFFDGKDIVQLNAISSESKFRSMRNIKDSFKKSYKGQHCVSQLQIGFMKNYGVGLRYRYTHGNQQFDIYFSPKEL